MKKELIKTDDYLLVVDDSEIKVGDCYLSPSGIWFYNHLNPNHVKECQKIIAHLPLGNSPILEGVPLLPPLEVEDDVEKLNEDLFDKGSDNVLHPQYQMRTFFNIGYNKAKEKYKFTEEDAKYLFECGRNFQINADITFTVAREHLSQPKTPTHFEFEIEYDCCGRYENCKGCDATAEMINLRHKTATNSQGQQVVCGKYIY
jgi:hypothetical protein